MPIGAIVSVGSECISVFLTRFMAPSLSGVQHGGKHGYIYLSQTAHSNNFKVDTARPWVQGNTPGGIQFCKMPGSRDNQVTDRHTDSGLSS